MPLSNPDDALLLIRCPSCGQRFKVGEDLRGRTVECGGCEHRFRINDEVIVRGQKFYPGERKNSALSRFQRVPLAMAPGIGKLQTIHYADAPDPTEFEPVAPQRIIAGVVGVAGMVMMALLLMFGASPGGALDGMTLDRRLVMAGFTGLLGTAMLVYANPRARLKSGGFGLLLGAGLLAIPCFFKEGSVPLSELALAVTPPANKPETETPANATMTRLREQIGTTPLEAEVARLARDNSNKHAMGIWLKGLSEQNRLLVRDYIMRVTGADPQSILYPRGGGDFLMVVTGINQSLDELAGHATALGTLEKLYPELGVLEIRVNNENFAAGSIEKLSNQKDPEFYELNKKELDSIDLDRVLRAVQRLAEVEPKIYRSDITHRLLALLEAPGVAFKGDLCRALAVWSEPPGPAGDAALKEATALLARKGKIPPEMIALIVKERNPGALTILDALWIQSPTKWEALYGDLGPLAEATLIRRFPESEGMLRQSVVRMLGRVGSTASLPVLQAAVAGADPELKVLLEKATTAIRKRLEP